MIREKYLRRITAIMIISAVVLIITVLVVQSDTSVGETIVVDDDGNCDYEKIQYAIDNATSGDSIRVWEGTYYENVVVDQSISLIGNGSETTTINGGASGTVVKITANGVSLSRFNIIGSNTDNRNRGIVIESDDTEIINNTCSINGIELHYYNTCIISNNEFSGNYNSIMGWGSNACTITNNRWSGKNHGDINLISSKDCKIMNNLCSDNAIRIESSESCTITDNTCSENGILLHYSSACTLKNNIMAGKGIMINGNFEHWNTHDIDTTNMINGNSVYYYKNSTGFTVPSGAGQIILADCHEMRVEGQNCSSGYYGIQVGYSSMITLSNNVCSLNMIAGIQLEASDDCIITNNKCFENDAGIYLEDSDDCTISRNICDENSEYGILVRYSNGCSIMDNICSSSNDNGIYMLYSSDSSLENNTITNNTIGILLRCSDDCEIMNNIFTLNSEDGIYLSGCFRCEIQNNRMNDSGIFFSGNLEHWNSHTIDHSNTVNGKSVGYYINISGFTIPSGSGQIILVNCSWINVLDQNCSNCSVGIMVGFSSNITIHNNTCSSNSKEGIYLYESSICTITNNTCSGNINNGIYLYKSSICVLYGNKCTGNDDGINIWFTRKNKIMRNTCTTNHGSGIGLFSSINCILKNNTMKENGITIYGDLEEWNSHIIDITNTVNDKNVYYLKNVTDFTVPAGAGEVILGNCTWIRVIDQNCSLGTIGIMIGYSSNVTLENNTCSSNNDKGIYVVDSIDCKIMKNRCLSNNNDGIYLWETRFSLVENNTSSSNRYGIFLRDGYMNIITNNTCSFNKKNGIHLYYVNNSAISDNLCLKNQIGIHFHGTRFSTLENNTCLNNKDGFNLYFSRNNTLADNNCTTNVDCGIYLQDSGYSTLGNNTCSNNKEGITIVQSGSVSLRKNVCISNEADGINIRDSNNCVIENNTCTDNFNGIFLNFSSENTIKFNMCFANNHSGIHLEYTDECMITQNTITSNKETGILVRISDENEINNNTISENTYGISLIMGSERNEIHFNRIFENHNGGINASDSNGILVNATHNYWGSNTGPYHPTLNPNGKGNSVSDNVHFRPWLNENGTVNASSNEYPEPHNGGEDTESDVNSYIAVTIFIGILGLVVIITIMTDTWYPLLEKRMMEKETEPPDKSKGCENTDHEPETRNDNLVEEEAIRLEIEMIDEQQTDPSDSGVRNREEEHESTEQ